MASPSHKKTANVCIGETLLPVGQMRFRHEKGRQCSDFRHLDAWVEQARGFSLSRHLRADEGLAFMRSETQPERQIADRGSQDDVRTGCKGISRFSTMNRGFSFLAPAGLIDACFFQRLGQG